MFSTGSNVLHDDVCNWLYYSDYKFYFDDDDFVSNDSLHYYLPPLEKVLLSESDSHINFAELEDIIILMRILNESSQLIINIWKD